MSNGTLCHLQRPRGKQSRRHTIFHAPRMWLRVSVNDAPCVGERYLKKRNQRKTPACCSVVRPDTYKKLARMPMVIKKEEDEDSKPIVLAPPHRRVFPCVRRWSSSFVVHQVFIQFSPYRTQTPFAHSDTHHESSGIGSVDE